MISLINKEKNKIKKLYIYIYHIIYTLYLTFINNTGTAWLYIDNWNGQEIQAVHKLGQTV